MTRQLTSHTSHTPLPPIPPPQTHSPLSLLPSLFLSGGNQRETDRARAQARAAKNGAKEKISAGDLLKKKEADAEAMRKKQQAAEAKRQAAAGGGGGGKEEKEEKKK